MAEALDKLRKLRGRSLAELRVRGAQALAAFAERRGFSAQTRLATDAEFFKQIDLDANETRRANRDSPGDPRRPRSAGELLAHFRGRTSPRFFASFDDAGATVAAWRARFGGGYEKSLVEHAERLVAGRFDLLGLRDLSFGDPVDWHVEPVSGKRAPLAHWSRISYLDPSVAGDKKFTWELNRHQHFQTLGRAYLATEDERYAATFAAHLASWMDANPPKQGINWASSLEVGFRAISWLWALHFFRESPRLTPSLFTRALKFLFLHARHLETYLSTYFSPNTHLTGEALGLFYLGTLLPELEGASRWRETGRRVLTEQLARHVRADGTYFEQSSYYHRYTADFYTHFLLLARANGEGAETYVEQKLVALLDHLMLATRPDGTTPLYGDDDGGRLSQLEELRAPDDFRAALSDGAALFARADYKFVAEQLSEETLWLQGSRGVETFDSLEAAPPARASSAFGDGGYYVMRDGWTRRANFMLLDCGAHGADNCGHAHADALSFDAAARGRTLLVDPGTYTYTGASDLRDHFRSTSAHNALTVDGESSSVPRGAFHWSHVARASARRWTSRPRFDYFEGEHDGFARLAGQERYTRAVLFVKNDYWIVRDRVRSSAPHRYDLNFHLAAGTRARVEGREGADAVRVSDSGGEDLLTLCAFGGDSGSWAVERGWVSRCYGAREPAPVCRFAARGAGAQEFFTFVLPQGARSESATTVEGVRRKSDEARAGVFELRRGAAFDLLLTRDGGEIAGDEGSCEDDRLTSDFAWTWARFDEAGALAEMILIEGRRCSVDGLTIFESRERVACVVVSRDGDEFVVETDDGRKRIAAGESLAGVGR
ncbi:MAG: heparinase II/III family protein [Acidobacteria bacterium]|nr:heparinase II/III family protein [Acidobacteriota bacterium]